MNIYTKVLILPLCLIFTFFLHSCQSKAPADTLDRALKLSGDNRAELQQVLQHFAADSDSTKLQAAEFLVRHLPLGHSYGGDLVDQYDNIFNEFKQADTDQKAAAVFASYKEKYGALQIWKLNLVPDYAQVDAAFLIENIDLAFQAWKSYSWSKDIGFELFCEAILPYRVMNEPLEPWRPQLRKHFSWLLDSLSDHATAQEVFGLINWSVNQGFNTGDFMRYPFTPTCSNILKSKTGTCREITALTLQTARAFGVPAVVDFTPKWGNRNSGHYWAVMLDKDRNPYWCYKGKDKVARNDQPISASTFRKDTIGHSHLPPGVEVTDIRTIPKVYRRQFVKDPEKQRLINLDSNGELINFFADARVIDVTSMYFPESVTIDLRLTNVAPANQFVYLCLFRRDQWEPVAVSRIENERVSFQDMGQGIVYFPMVNAGDEFVAVDTPFIIQNGQKRNFVPDPKQLETVILNRKTNMFQNIVNYANYMLGGRIEGANQADFSDAKTLHEIRQTPLYMQTIALEAGINYRYIRYVSPAHGRGDIAELAVYGIVNGEEIRHSGATAGTMAAEEHPVEHAFDNNWDSYFRGAYRFGEISSDVAPGMVKTISLSGKNSRNWVSLDLGEKKKIDILRFCPRNDTNVVCPGEEYQLYYWDNTWKPLGQQKASDMHLVYDKVPKGALLWLRNLTRGKEENVFIYENDQQHFF